MYQKIDCSEYRNVFVIGDLHGCYDVLMKALKEEGFDRSKDLVVCVGDLIDRGSKNLECLGLMLEDWFVTVRGNHEQLALDAITRPSYSTLNAWAYNGGQWFYDLEDQGLAEHLINMTKDLPYVIELNFPNNEIHKKIVVCHSDYPEDTYEYGKPVDKFDILWSRERIDKKLKTVVKGADLFIHGHTPLKEVLSLGNRLYIDTGAVFGGILTVLQVNDE